MNPKAIIGTVIAVVVGVIGLAIVVEIITNQSFTGLVGTVMDYVPVLMAVGLLIVAVAWAYNKR